jgi:integrase
VTETKPRRARGEGGVHYDERRRRFIAQRTVGYDGRGMPIRKRASGKSESAALKALRERVRLYEAGIVAGAERYTVGQAVEDWLTYGRGEVSAKTLRVNRDVYDRHIRPLLGGRRVKDLRPQELDQWLASLAPHLSKSSLKQAHSVLRRSLTRAASRGLAERNVATLCTVPKGRPGRRSKSLTQDQVSSVLQGTVGHWIHPYIVVSLTTGLRTEEIRALTWDRVHLNPDEGPPRVEVWRAARAGGDTKTRSSRRTLALPQAAQKALRAQRRWQEQKRATSQDRWADEKLVFTTSVGTPLRADNVRREFRLALSGVPGIDPKDWTPRELRHSFVSVMSANAVPLEEVSRLVGHSDTTTTETVYRHELRPVLLTGARTMDAVFGSGDPPSAGVSSGR